MQFTIIVSHGRSGSTLLQGVLNAIPGWRIQGENGNFIHDLYRSCAALDRARREAGTEAFRPTHPWFGAAELDADAHRAGVADLIRAALARAAPETASATGFKEIRYLDIYKADSTGQQLDAYLAFLREVLSPLKIVFLTRDPRQTSESGWFADRDRDETIAMLKGFRDFCEGYCARNPDHAFALRYGHLKAGSRKLNEMFRFLGAAPDPARLNATLATPHSYGGKANAAPFVVRPRAAALGQQPDLLAPYDAKRRFRGPDFMIIGAQKAGTTWLFEMLDDHPRFNGAIYKETGFFNMNWRPEYDAQPTDAVMRRYARYWREPDRGITCEASPGYIAFREAPERVARCSPHSRFVVLLRDPAERFFSVYNMWRRAGRIDISFAEFTARSIAEAKRERLLFDDERDWYDAHCRSPHLAPIMHGFYAIQLRRWFAHFPEDRFFISTTHGLNRRDVLERLFGHVGADPAWLRDEDLSRAVRDHHQGDPMGAEERRALNAFYAPANEDLRQLLGGDAPDW